VAPARRSVVEDRHVAQPISLGDDVAIAAASLSRSPSIDTRPSIVSVAHARELSRRHL